MGFGPRAGDYGGQVIVPASDETVIAVGATTYDKRLADYSSRGMDLNVVAPGGASGLCTSGDWSGGIIGPGVGHTREYRCDRGTSFAAPHVTGIVALMLSQGRFSDPEEISRTLEITAQRASFEFDDHYGWGMVDAYGAVTGGVPMVFVGTKEPGQINALLPPVKAKGQGGVYQLTGVSPGRWQVYAWVDVDMSGTINEGDYFGSTHAIHVQARKAYTGNNIVLTRYEGEELSLVF